MSDPKKLELERLVDALDDEPIDAAAEQQAVKRLGIDLKKWATSIRARVDAADRTDRAERFRAATQAMEVASDRYDAKRAEPVRSLEDARAEFRRLSARMPRERAAASVHFHKFEEATAEELAEMIKAIKHLLGEDE
jgi:hypothetical protein